MPSANLKARVIRTRVEQGKAGLFYATSPELRGLLVAQPTIADLAREIPAAIKEMYAACGVVVVVTPIEAGEDDGGSFVAIPAEIARKQLEENAA